MLHILLWQMLHKFVIIFCLTIWVLHNAILYCYNSQDYGAKSWIHSETQNLNDDWAKLAIFTPRDRGNRIGPVFPSVHLSVFLSVTSWCHVTSRIDVIGAKINDARGVWVLGCFHCMDDCRGLLPKIPFGKRKQHLCGVSFVCKQHLLQNVFLSMRE